MSVSLLVEINIQMSNMLTYKMFEILELVSQNSRISKFPDLENNSVRFLGSQLVVPDCFSQN